MTEQTGRPIAQIGFLVRAPKTSELIAKRLREQIVRGELRPGDTLPPEAQLLAQFRVSRPTLREAFRILETESLIDVRRGARGGAQVKAPDLGVAARHVGLLLQLDGTTIADVYEARLMTEPICAGLFAKRRTAADLSDLRACVEELRLLVEAGTARFPDSQRWSRVTYQFHELIMRGSGNNTLAVQGGVLADIVNTHLASVVAGGFNATETPERFRRTLRSYEKLVQLVEDKDAAGAEAHWRTHMEVAAQSLLRDDLRTKPVVDLFD